MGGVRKGVWAGARKVSGCGRLKARRTSSARAARRRAARRRFIHTLVSSITAYVGGPRAAHHVCDENDCNRAPACTPAPGRRPAAVVPRGAAALQVWGAARGGGGMLPSGVARGLRDAPRVRARRAHSGARQSARQPPVQKQGSPQSLLCRRPTCPLPTCAFSGAQQRGLQRVIVRGGAIRRHGVRRVCLTASHECGARRCAVSALPRQTPKTGAFWNPRCPILPMHHSRVGGVPYSRERVRAAADRGTGPMCIPGERLNSRKIMFHPMAHGGWPCDAWIGRTGELSGESLGRSADKPPGAAHPSRHRAAARPQQHRCPPPLPLLYTSMSAERLQHVVRTRLSPTGHACPARARARPAQPGQPKAAPPPRSVK